MSRFFSRFPSILLFSAGTVLCFSGCASTIITETASRPVPPVPADIISHREIREDARRITKEDPTVLARATPEKLIAWAGEDPKRLTQGAELILLRAESSRSRVSGKPDGRSGLALLACDLAWRSLLASGVPASDWMTEASSRRAAIVYNTALTIFISGEKDRLASGKGNLSVDSPLGPLIVTSRYAAGTRFPAGYFDQIIPADNIKITGFTTRARVSGLGVPLVGVRQRTADRNAEMRLQPPGQGVHAPLNAIARFEHSRSGPPRLILEISDLNQTSTTRLRDRTVRLAGDFTAPLALSFDDINDLMVGVRALLNVGSVENYTGIYLTEPVDRKRTPVLLLHGLSSSPLVWRNVVTQAMKDPRIRENYQFWYAFYSSGEPITPTTASIRSRIAAIRQANDSKGTAPLSKNMIIVGYSMGGVIARALATDIGNHLWATVTDRPFEDIELKDDDRALIRDWIFWKPDLTIKEVVFLATPHRGTRMADASFAQLGRKFIGLPTTFLQFQKRIFTALGSLIENPDLPTRAISGVDSLSPSAPIYKAFATAPFVSSAETHSIIGDRGRGDTPDSSDGVVGYWSSHLDSAVSEIIVPTGHDVQTDPNSEAEIRRVLLEALPTLDR